MKTAKTVAAVIAVVLAYGLMGTSDLNEQNRAEKHMAETIAAAREAAHRKAQELRDAQLLDDANHMMWPLAQVTAK